MKQRHRYPSDIIDSEWELIERLLPQAKSGIQGGRPPEDQREVLNGIRYVVRTGCAWRMMPHDLPKWSTCYHYFRVYKRDGVWQRIHDELRGDVREAAGRQRQPSAAIIDSQSVKTTEKGGSAAMMRARKSRAGSDICSSM